MPDFPKDQLKHAIEADDRDRVRALVADEPKAAESINGPLFSSGVPALAGAKSLEMVDLLRALGADPVAVGEWWAPGFGLRMVDPEVARALVTHGAKLTVHAAAALGLVDELTQMLDADLALVHAKGGDDGRPLHFARDLATAQLLVDRGAELDARDSDHGSTPAQWLLRDAPDVTRFLLASGAEPDIFLAAALGDRELAERLVVADSTVLAQRIGKEPFYAIGEHDGGGTILQWTAAFNSYPHQIAKKTGHDDLFTWMYGRSDPTTKLLVACLLGMRAEAEQLAAETPGLVQSLDDVDKKLVAIYCWETNADLEAVRLMLDLGFPVDATEHNHGHSAVHNAAWGGYAEIVDLLIERGARLDERDPRFDATPLDYALHCALVDGRHPEGQYARVVAALIDAGSPWESTIYPTGNAEIDEALEPRLRKRIEGVALLGDGHALDAFLQANPGPAKLTEALVGAAKGGHPDICARLLEVGAELNPAAPARLLPLQAAVGGNSLKTVKFLLGHGADPAARNVNGSTVFHSAASLEDGSKMLALLLENAPSEALSAENRFGYTPLRVAEERGRTVNAAFFREHAEQSPKE